MYQLTPKSLVIVLLLSVMLGYGQTNTSNIEIINSARSVSSFDLRSKDIVGSSYIEEDFLPAKITNNDKVFSIRYNVYQDEMEMEKDGAPYYLPKSFGYTVSFINSNKLYQVYSLNSNEKVEPSFFLVLSVGDKITLLAKERIRLNDAVKPKSGYDKYKPPTLEQIKNKFYIGYANYSTAELPSKKKEFLKLFSSDSSTIEKFVKENKLGIKKQEDLIKIFDYYNTL
jgi:hypothetical protein